VTVATASHFSQFYYSSASRFHPAKGQFWRHFLFPDVNSEIYHLTAATFDKSQIGGKRGLVDNTQPGPTTSPPTTNPPNLCLPINPIRFCKSTDFHFERGKTAVGARNDTKVLQTAVTCGLTVCVCVSVNTDQTTFL
jgi:hypothetical protein